MSRLIPSPSVHRRRCRFATSYVLGSVILYVPASNSASSWKTTPAESPRAVCFEASEVLIVERVCVSAQETGGHNLWRCNLLCSLVTFDTPQRLAGIDIAVITAHAVKVCQTGWGLSRILLMAMTRKASRLTIGHACKIWCNRQRLRCTAVPLCSPAPDSSYAAPRVSEPRNTLQM